MKQILSHILIITLFLNIQSILCLRTHRLSQDLSFYDNDKQIQSETDKLVRQNPQIYSKKQCQNDADYKYILVTSPNKTTPTHKFTTIITCNIHAREFITSQICLSLLSSLKHHQQILSSMSLIIFYNSNKLRQTTLIRSPHCIRKNQNEVDMNRNFPTEFNYYNAKKKSEIYPGEYPMSETMPKCLSDIVESIENIQNNNNNYNDNDSKLDFFLDLHSGQRAMYYQEKQGKYGEITNNNQVKLLNQIKDKFNFINITKIKTLKKDGQAINGHIFADLKVRKNVKYSLLYETYGIDEDEGSNNDNNDKNYKKNKNNDKNNKKIKKKQPTCFEQFNPKTKKDLQKWKEQWTNAIIYSLKRVVEFLEEDSRRLHNKYKK